MISLKTVTKSKRSELVQRFNETDEAKVFLISLKVGGTGLNLTAANVVIHVDPWWNADFSFSCYFSLGFGAYYPYGHWFYLLVFFECLISLLNNGIIIIYAFNFLFSHNEP